MFFRKEDDGGDNTYHVYLGGAVQEWSAGPVIRMGPQSGDPKMIGVHDGNTVKPVVPFKVKEWQHLRVVFDITKQKYSVYVDGKVIADNFNFRNPAHKTIQWLMIGFDGGSGIIGYADNIELGEGEGKDAMNRALAVKANGKLTTTWAEIKLR